MITHQAKVYCDILSSRLRCRHIRIIGSGFVTWVLVFAGAEGGGSTMGVPHNYGVNCAYMLKSNENYM